jgi:hypothetical protein
MRRAYYQATSLCRTISVTCGVLFTVALAAGCDGSDRNASLNMMLFDISGSTRAIDGTRDRYTDVAEKVYTDLGGGDRFVADRISGASLQEARLELDVTIPTFDPVSQTTGGHRREKEEALATLETGVSSLLSGDLSKCTDILSALTLAAKVFQNASPEVRKRLVVVSDMVETCSVNFRRHSLDAEGIKAIIEEQRAEGRLPDLSGVEVYVAGAAATSKMPSSRVNAIQNFWVQYFEATGANLPPSRYGPTLFGWP